MIKIGLAFIMIFAFISLVSSGVTLLYVYIQYKSAYKRIPVEYRKNKCLEIKEKNIKIVMMISEGIALLLSIIPVFLILRVLNVSHTLMGVLVMIRLSLIGIRVRKVKKEDFFELLEDSSAQDHDHAIYK